MKRYKTLIVEDESAALNDLLYYLNMEPYKSVVNVASTAITCRDAIDKLIEGSFQLLILDIELPDGLCFEIINKMGRAALGEIVFCTRYGNLYAQEMIDAGPIHYLKKPCSRQKVQNMILKIEDIFSKKLNPPLFIALFDDDNTKILVDKDDILYVQYISKRNTKFFYQLKNGGHKHATFNQSLISQLERLPRKFVQCHREYIINIDFIDKLPENMTGGFTITMPNGEKVEISKHFRDDVLSRKGVS